MEKGPALGELGTLCQACAAPVEAGVRFCENCEQLPEPADPEEDTVYRISAI
jgi:hypothetical protein